MFISRHEIDSLFLNGMQERAELSLENMPRLVSAAKKNPQSLGILANAAYVCAASCYLLDPLSDKVKQALQIENEALNALFSCASHDDGEVVVSLAAEKVVYSAKPDKGSVHVGAWLEGFFLNIIFGNFEAARSFCLIPTSLVRESPTTASEYRYLYKDALCAYVNRDANVIAGIIAALKATDPEKFYIADKYLALSVGVPQIEVLLHVVTKDTKYNVAMHRAIENFRDYWSKPKDKAHSFRSFMSVELLGLAALGLDAGLSLDVDSPYLPMHLISKR